MTLAYSTQSNIITLHDAITDSPVYRASTLHFDKQLDVFSQWINDLARQTKAYAEKLKQLNTETIALAAKLNPTNMVNYQLLDSKIADIAANNFGDALKTNLTFKMKTVSDLEGKFTGPIEKFVDEHIRAFKKFREQHKHALTEYESALANYATLSNTRKDSAATINTTTQQLHQARKKYIEMSSEHITRIAKLRHDLEHTLVEQYSTTISSRKDFYNDAQVWKQLNSMLFSWADWLAEDKRTYQVETRKQQLAQQTLEKEYLDDLQLKHGTATKIRTKLLSHSTKSGYLMTRLTNDTSSPWKRQWFFIHGGYFGSCKVTDPEVSPSITLDDCVPLQFCQIKLLDSSDRRFCFELNSNQHPQKAFFILQAESEQDLQDWASALTAKSPNPTSPSFDTATRNHPSSIMIGKTYDPNNDLSQPRSPASLISKSKSTTVVSTPTDIPVTLSTNSDLSISSSSPGSTMFSNLSGSPPPLSASSLSPVAFKMTYSSLDRQNDISTAPSMTPLLLEEITHGSHQETVLNDNKTKLWGTPRTILPSPGSTQRLTVKHGESYKSMHGKIVWPINLDSHQQSHVVPDLPGYTSHLKDKTQNLRRLFNGVSPQEAVLDVLTVSFLKKQDDMATSDYQDSIKDIKTPSKLGNYYWGSVYVTQDTFWFYSNLSCSCITTIALKLKNIEDIQVAQDTHLVIHMIDNGGDDTAPSPLVFSVILDDTETIVDKLRFLIYNAKLADPMQLRNVYRKVAAMSSTQSPSRSPSISTLDSLSDDQSYMLNHHGTTPHHTPSSRMVSTDTAATLVTPLSNSSHPTPPTKIKKAPAKKKKVIKKPFVDPDTLPDHITKPSGPLDCHCDDHLDRRDAEMELPISAKRLYELMFSDEATAPPANGGVWNSKTEGIDGHDLRVSHWAPLDGQEDGQMKRTLKYWMPVANPVVRMKEAEVVETQILLRKDDYLCYVVQISTKTEALPFADAFIPSVRYCITYIDDSRCKLTCHLGVRWTKWVMAKIIVTKAALAGMSDSVNIFVPILKEAASAIQVTVENLRQSEQESATQTISEYEDESDKDNGDNDDKGVFEANDNNVGKGHEKTTTIPALDMDVHVKATTTPPVHTQRNLNGDQTTDLQPQPKTPATTSSKNKQSTATTAPTRTELSTTTTTTTSETSAVFKSKTTKTHHKLVKEKLIDSSGQEAPSLVKAALDSIWPPGAWTSGTLVIMCLFYIIWTFTASSFVTNGMDGQQPVIHTQVVSHAVYLRDLDDGFIKKSLRPPYIDSQCYTLFLQARQDEREYTWYDTQHYRLALEYGSSREKIGIQRHDIMTTFHALNTADTDLLETEYLNWLLDNRQRCRGEQQHQFNDTNFNMCDQINTQIGTYF
ncbi:hypothetical protein BCR42DRAFT_426010 [Absidia repens]|uniref:Uncharacterized protein n=1 Tax=Absidia repens TaxID=90262 RepID=A0A1X2I2B0_9FUNG|nr:hypothetical protein BCR42DRAFT_426010 [Absidia repens]